jgi:hypothetical protein
LERSVDPACRHYCVDKIRTRKGCPLPLLFDVYVGDHRGDEEHIPDTFFVLLHPSARPFLSQTYDLGEEGMGDEEVIGEAIDRYLAEHGNLLRKTRASKGARR